jgi:NADH-quinone oxidoreductase subunit G
MEAALRTAYEKITGKVLEPMVFTEVRGFKGIKKCNIDIKGKEFKIAVVSSLKNARKILDDIISEKVDYDFIEVMACPGGCINGGGQPYINSSRMKLKKRMDSIYSEEEKNILRKSHDNPEIQQVYKEFLGEPNSPISHELLHTKYRKI